MHETRNIETERLLLRRLEIDDYEEMYNTWENDARVTKYLTWEPHKNKEETKQLVEYWIKEYDKDYTYRWLVTLKDTKKIIGLIDVINKSINEMTCELGYCYGYNYWNHGYATEALKAVIEYLHKEGFPVVYAEYLKSNPASGRVMAKAGMVYEATLKSRTINKEGKREDLIVYTSIKE